MRSGRRSVGSRLGDFLGFPCSCLSPRERSRPPVAWLLLGSSAAAVHVCQRDSGGTKAESAKSPREVRETAVSTGKYRSASVTYLGRSTALFGESSQVTGSGWSDRVQPASGACLGLRPAGLAPANALSARGEPHRTPRRRTATRLRSSELGQWCAYVFRVASKFGVATSDRPCVRRGNYPSRWQDRS